MRNKDTYERILRALMAESTCLKRQNAAIVFSKNRSIIATGFNGAPKGIKHCTDIGFCAREDSQPGENLHLCRSTHAEANCIANAALEGTRLEGGDMYTYYSPCFLCAKLIINTGIHRVVYWAEYPAPGAIDLLREGGVIVERY